MRSPLKSVSAFTWQSGNSLTDAATSPEVSDSSSVTLRLLKGSDCGNSRSIVLIFERLILGLLLLCRRHRFGIWCEARSQFVQSSQCLVFGVRGDRSWCVKGDRSGYNYRSGRVAIDKIVMRKRDGILALLNTGRNSDFPIARSPEGEFCNIKRKVDSYRESATPYSALLNDAMNH